jgi:hypothetical protein
MKRFFTVVIFATLFSCISVDELAPPVDESFLKLSQSSSQDLPSLKMGRHLYTARCGSCHSLDPVTAYNFTEWLTIMHEEGMAEKSKFSSIELSSVLNYLKTVGPIADELNKKLHP